MHLGGFESQRPSRGRRFLAPSGASAPSAPAPLPTLSSTNRLGWSSTLAMDWPEPRPRNTHDRGAYYPG